MFVGVLTGILGIYGVIVALPLFYPGIFGRPQLSGVWEMDDTHLIVAKDGKRPNFAWLKLEPNSAGTIAITFDPLGTVDDVSDHPIYYYKGKIRWSRQGSGNATVTIWKFGTDELVGVFRRTANVDASLTLKKPQVTLRLHRHHADIGRLFGD
jgi:hypothetical protein